MAEFLNIDGYQVQQHKEELDFIVSKATGKKNYMEIGVYGGGTFNYVSKFVKGKHIAVDLSLTDEVQAKLKKTVKNCSIIIGDTHDYKTLERVKEVLKGELLDVLFIDGDHSAEGVKRDFEMYKHLVSDGGVILFHDIIKSKFHAKYNCFVDEFWSEAPQEKSQVCVSTEWGGVGCIENKKVDWKCYQIYFNKETKKKLQEIFIPFDNSKDKSIFYFENNVILKIYEQLDKEKSAYIGTCSWKQAEKTRMGSVLFTELAEATNCDADVILFPHAKFIYENVVERNRIFYSPIYQLMELFDKENILPFKMLTDKWSCSYNNYWLAKKEVYKEYCEKILKPAIKAMEENEKISFFISSTPFNHGGKKYPIAPFLLELLMGFYVNKFNIKHKIITPPLDCIKLGKDEVMCEIINPNLVPDGKTTAKFKRNFALGLQASGYLKIIE